jgi:hypothetical protein
VFRSTPLREGDPAQSIDPGRRRAFDELGIIRAGDDVHALGGLLGAVRPLAGVTRLKRRGGMVRQALEHGEWEAMVRSRIRNCNYQVAM